jgi:hypothetical protein
MNQIPHGRWTCLQAVFSAVGSRFDPPIRHGDRDWKPLGRCVNLRMRRHPNRHRVLVGPGVFFRSGNRPETPDAMERSRRLLEEIPQLPVNECGWVFVTIEDVHYWDAFC